MVIPAEATLTVHQISSLKGYTTINMGKVELVKTTQTIVHIIDLDEIADVVHLIEDNLQKLDTTPWIEQELSNVHAKILILRRQNKQRKKRGLINAVGSANKWLFGTMDNNDREEIMEQLKIIEENNHNAISNLNQQIKINQNFNNTMKTLKATIEQDRQEILNLYNSNTKIQKKVVSQQSQLNQFLKLKIIEDRLDIFLDNIASAKQGIIHPGLLTAKEITGTELDTKKLKNARMGLIEQDGKRLIFAIQIPESFESIPHKLLIPIPNKNHVEIDEEEQQFVEFNGIKYQYYNGVLYKNELKPLKNCITKRNCILRENKAREIKVLDQNTIICKNMAEIKIENNTCNDNNITLNGHYLININNCTITILNELLGNTNLKFIERFFYKEEIEAQSNESLKFDKIALSYIENLKHIQEIKFHRKINYVISSTSLVIASIVISIILVMCVRHKRIKFTVQTVSQDHATKAQNTLENSRSNFVQNEGEVMYPILGNMFKGLKIPSA